MVKQTKLEHQRMLRIRVSIWACAYELYDTSIVDDLTFDMTCLKIDLSIKTNRRDLDIWFKNNFEPSTGMWIYSHPELSRLKQIVERLIETRG